MEEVSEINEFSCDIPEMGGACGPYGERERSVQGAGGETRGEETAGETQA